MRHGGQRRWTTGGRIATINERSSKTVVSELLVRIVAATYSPTWWGSTIGDGELNFSVRNGKRWILTAITATIYVLRKDIAVHNVRFRVIALACTRFSGSLPYSVTLLCLSRSQQLNKASQRKMSGY